MKPNKIILIMLLSLSAFVSCKKDKKVETKEYLSGFLNLEFPKYVEQGYSKEFCIDSLMTLFRPDDGTIGYYFRSTSSSTNDTLVLADGTVVKKNFTVTVPEEMGSNTITFGAFCAEKYYSFSTSVSYDVVKPGYDGTGSLTEFEITEDELSFVDSRDNKSYFYITIGSTDWMRMNLAWVGAGASFENSEVMDGIFGRFYTQTEALSACPEGWRLPSDKDWFELAKTLSPDIKEGTDFEGVAGKLMGDFKFNDKKVWEYWKEVYVSDDSRLSLIPAGYAHKEDKYIFKGDNQYSILWTSDQDGENGVIRYVYEKKDILYTAKVSSVDFACSVRCVR